MKYILESCKPKRLENGVTTIGSSAVGFFRNCQAGIYRDGIQLYASSYGLHPVIAAALLSGDIEVEIDETTDTVSFEFELWACDQVVADAAT